MSDILSTTREIVVRVSASLLSRLVSGSSQRVWVTLGLAFSMFFLFPLLALLAVVHRFDLLHHRDVLFFFLGLLVFFFLGFLIFRALGEQLSQLSERIEMAASARQPLGAVAEKSELGRIANSVQQLLVRLEWNSQRIETQLLRDRLLREFAESVREIDQQDALWDTALDTIMQGTSAQGAAILLLDDSGRHHLEVITIAGEFGQQRWRVGDQVPVEPGAWTAKVLADQRPLFLRDYGDPQAFSQECGPLLVLPLMFAERINGVICLASRSDGALFTSMDLDFAIPLAGLLAERCARIEQRRQLNDHQRQLDALDRIIVAGNRGLARNQVFKAMVEALAEVIDIKICLLTFVERRELLEVAEVVSEEPVAVQTGERLPLQRGSVRKLLAAERAVILEELVGELSPREASYLYGLGLRGAVLLPFRMLGMVRGILFIGLRQAQQLDAVQLLLLRQFGDQLGILLHHADLRRKVEEQGRKLDALHWLAQRLVKIDPEPAAICQQVGELLGSLIPVEAGAIYLQEKEVLVAESVFGIQAQGFTAGRIARDRGICSYVCGKGESVRVRDAAASPHLSHLVERFGPGQVHSLLAVPISFAGRCWGMVHLWNRLYGPFTSFEEKLLRAVSTQVAMALAALLGSGERGRRD